MLIEGMDNPVKRQTGIIEQTRRWDRMWKYLRVDDNVLMSMATAHRNLQPLYIAKIRTVKQELRG